MPEIEIMFDGNLHDWEVTDLGEGLFRLDDEVKMQLIPFMEDDELEAMPNFGDVFRASSEDDSTYRYETLVERGPYKHTSFMLPYEDPMVERLTELVQSNGGVIYRYSFGFAFVSLPNDCPFEIPRDLGKLLD